MELKYKRIKHLPQIENQLVRAHVNDAGADIKSNVDIIIPAHTDKIISTGIAVEIPEGFFGRVSSRSGLKAKHNVTAFHGTVDSAYRGELKVILYNGSNLPFKVNKGDRIAQLVVVPCVASAWEEIEEFTQDSDRGENGFGSSGV